MNNLTNRREILQALVLAPLALLVRSIPVSLDGYPLPEFAIGDLIAYDWADDDDEDDLGSGTEFGEIVGLRWIPETKQYLATNPLPPKCWVYFVCWTHSTAVGYESAYPHHDEDPYPASDLRRVNHD